MTLASSNHRWLFLAVVVAVLAAVACGESATATPATATAAPTLRPIPATAVPIANVGEVLTAEEEEYIEQVRSGWRKFHDKAEGFRAVFAQVYSLKSRLFEALHDAGAGTAFDGALQALEEIDPPAQFQEDHQIMVETLSAHVAIDREIGDAVENQDLAAFAIANARLTESSILMASRLDPRVCNATMAADLPFRLCDFFSETVPGGDYGSQVYEKMTTFAAGVFSRSIQFGPEFEEEEILATLSVIQPELTKIHDGTLVEIAGLQPPNEFAEGHNLLVKYLDDALAINRSRSTSVDAQDPAAHRSLSGEARTLYCDAKQELGAGELRDLVRVYFLDPTAICGGSEY